MSNDHERSRDTTSFNVVISCLVENKEKYPHNHEYAWSEKDIEHITTGLSFMQEHERAAFMERYQDYQIVKALDGVEIPNRNEI